MRTTAQARQVRESLVAVVTAMIVAVLVVATGGAVFAWWWRRAQDPLQQELLGFSPMDFLASALAGTVGALLALVVFGALATGALSAARRRHPPN